MIADLGVDDVDPLQRPVEDLGPEVVDRGRAAEVAGDLEGAPDLPLDAVVDPEARAGEERVEHEQVRGRFARDPGRGRRQPAGRQLGLDLGQGLAREVGHLRGAQELRQ